MAEVDVHDVSHGIHDVGAGAAITTASDYGDACGLALTSEPHNATSPPTSTTTHEEEQSMQAMLDTLSASASAWLDAHSEEDQGGGGTPTQVPLERVPYARKQSVPSDIFPPPALR